MYQAPLYCVPSFQFVDIFGGTYAKTQIEGTNFKPPECFYLRAPCCASEGTLNLNAQREEGKMAESVYKIIELVGTSETSWEDAAKNAVEKASKSLRDLRVAEVSELDMKVENGKVTDYRARVKLSFKYGGGE